MLGSAYQPLLEGRASLGIVGPMPSMAFRVTSERLMGIRMVIVAAPLHPLAEYPRAIPRAEMARHVQLVLTDRTALTDRQDFYIFSPSTWRLADLFVKRAFLLEGLGWGFMPRHVVEKDLTDGRLVALSVEDLAAEALIRPVSAAYPIASPPGPAARWFIDQIKRFGF